MRIVILSLLAVNAWTEGRAGEILAPTSCRYALADGDEIPDFRRHVVPLLGRLGCNGRACHGSFQGQGGFRLSLFGYDFQADHEGLAGGEEPRVNTADPSASLILQKPTLAIEHEGGRRFPADGWEHHLLRRWIAAGATGAAEDDAELVSLQAEPSEIAFAAAAQTHPLRVIAHWSDGSSEDVTPLCRFRTNDDSIAEVDAAGLVTAAGAGDTHVVAFYDNGIAAVPVILPVSNRIGSRYPSVPAPTRIDELVVAKLRKVGIVPAELCSDWEFLRRLSLDMTGTLPTPDEIEEFLADTSPDKRTKKIDELLSRPTYAAWWATRLCDLLGNTEQNLPVGGEQGLRREKSAQWYDWVYRRLDENVPYDQMVAGIVLAESRRPGQTAEDYYAEMSSYFREQGSADFSARETMPYFWTRGRFSPPQPLRFSYAFLGVRLECAQCHKHPYDQWTKEDYEGFQAFFESVGFNYRDRRLSQEMKQSLGLTADQDSGGYKRLFAELAKSGKTLPWQELTVSSLEKRLQKARRTAKVSGGRVFTPKLLGGEEVLAAEYDDAREPLMDWLRQQDNPYFARALVNRVWAGYFGVGIVEPPDDMNLANPPSNEPLLNHLAEGFIASGYDLKWLHREIASSRTYQLSWRPNETNARDERNFSRALVRRLPAEVLYDALGQATASEERALGMQRDPAVVRGRTIGVLSGYGRHDGTYALNLFGKPPREGICDCERSDEPSLLQTVYLRNDPELHALLNRPDGWLKELARGKGDAPGAEELVREAYLRTFSRPPTDAELAVGREHLAESSDPREALRDLLWALVNSKEFLLNH
ncbi:MAG: DUF1549 domain-containing protein [Planctomycetes bacterium]|nr:DUF1549 domain-containing protein [Planctomycetota bacterium]